MLNIGVIGYGGRMNTIAKKMIDTGKVHLSAIMDIHNAESKKKYLDEEKYDDIRYYDDADEMLKKEELDGICIGTRCSTHADYAVLAAKYNIPIYLEKPVGICEEDIEKLRGILHLNDKIVVSFPLRMSRIVTYVKELLDADKIGRVVHVQAYNNVPYGRGYYHKWYRDESITGGLFLQKATHDLDYINYLIGDDKPVRVCAMKSKQIYKGNKPAGLLCENCKETATCPESPENLAKNKDPYVPGKWCCFAEDVGNEDSGSALIEYESGMHVAYSQDFIARNGAGKRGARLIGYKGTIEFDWYEEKITVYKHLENIVETYKIPNTQGDHYGGDNELVRNFIGVMEGTEKSHATLQEGILSANMCLMCKRSAEEKRFREIL